MLSIRTDFATELRFPFRKYANLIISVVPKTDLIGISKIIFTDYFSSDKCRNDCLGYYIPDQRGKDSIIEINIPNLLENNIPKYLFDDYPEIAALFLSKTLFHEIGHHVHHFKRHGVRKKDYEKFADEYARAGYYNYLILRRSRILFSHRRAFWNVFRFDKDGRKQFSTNREKLIRWMEENGNGIPFP